MGHGDVYLYLFHRQKPFIKLNLQEELSKGHHCYNIPLIAAQLMQPLMTDSKTQKVVEVDSAIYSRYAGRYQIQADYVLTITTVDGKLFVQAPDTSITEFFPASSTKFFIRSLDAYVIFKPGESGQVDEAILYVGVKESVAKRIR